jgi:hypothetical protein
LYKKKRTLYSKTLTLKSPTLIGVLKEVVLDSNAKNDLPILFSSRVCVIFNLYIISLIKKEKKKETLNNLFDPNICHLIIFLLFN